MPEFCPNPSNRRRRLLPDMPPARTSQASSSSASSWASPSKASSGSSSSVSGGSQWSSMGPSPATLHPGYAASISWPPRTRLTRVACETCRRRIKCSGGRPRCAACVHNRSECTYQSLSSIETNCQALKRRLKEVKDEANGFQELYQCFKTGPESQAQEILRRIRMGADVGTLVRQIHNSDLLPQFPLVPETKLRFVFPYRTEMPAALQKPSNAYLASVMYEAIFAKGPPQVEAGEKQQQHRQQTKVEDLTKKYPPQYLQPYHAAKLVDSRLEMVDVTNWTQVISDKELFISILSAYLLHEYPGLPIFHKDTFLQALLDGDRRLCSPLLVNALMAEASHCYYGVPNRCRYWDPHNLGYRFLAEARRLWELQAEPHTLVQMQSATFLYLVYAHNGLDLLGMKFLATAVEIGHELGIFDVSESAYSGAPELANARLFTAWAVYQHATVAGFHFRREGLMQSPPQTPLPRPEKRPDLYGDINLQYPLYKGLSSIDYGNSFRAASMLYVILNDIAAQAFNTKKGWNSLPADRWIGFRNQLENWYREVPIPLLPRNIIWPVQFTIHMQYHFALITLARIHISSDTINGPTDSNALVSYARRAAAEIMPLAIVNLETVIRLHYARHSFECYEGHLTVFLTTMCSIMMESRVASRASSLESDVSEHLRSTLVLCMKGLAQQAQHVHIAGVICKLLFDRQTPEDRDLLRAHIGANELEKQSILLQPTYSAYPLELGRMTDAEPNRLGNLLRDHNPEVQ